MIIFLIANFLIYFILKDFRELNNFIIIWIIINLILKHINKFLSYIV